MSPDLSNRKTRRFTLAGSALIAGALALAGCDALEDETEDAQFGGQPIERALVTNVFEPAGPVDTLAFLPDPDAPWTGLLAASLRSGGFDIYTIDGDRIITASGPRLTGLAAAPVFELRGERFPILMGPDAQGAVRAFAMLREGREVIELPIQADGLNGDAAGLCLYRQGIGFLEVAVLGREDTAEIWRLSDQGLDALLMERSAVIDLPFPARSCAAADRDLVIAGPASGMARITLEGEVTASTNNVSVANLIHTDLLGRNLVLASLPEDGLLGVFDARTLEPLTGLELESGLNAPALEQPGALAISADSFGGMAFSSGVLAVFDGGDSRVKLIAREVVSRAVIGRRSDAEAES